MNKIFRLVRNAATGEWNVASELAKGRTKSGPVVALATLCALSAPALAVDYSGQIRSIDKPVLLVPRNLEYTFAESWEKSNDTDEQIDYVTEDLTSFLRRLVTDL